MDSELKKSKYVATDIRASASAGLNLPMYESLALLSGKNEAVIMHAGEKYHLKLTRQGKLILTK
jgi:hemin uptake protein HemP